jgi:hypothetical protein
LGIARTFFGFFFAFLAMKLSVLPGVPSTPTVREPARADEVFPVLPGSQLGLPFLPFVRFGPVSAAAVWQKAAAAGRQRGRSAGCLRRP